MKRCRERGCPWRGEPDECPWHGLDAALAADDAWDSGIGALMRERPGGAPSRHQRVG